MTNTVSQEIPNTVSQEIPNTASQEMTWKTTFSLKTSFLFGLRMKVKAVFRLHNHHLDLPKYFLCFSLTTLFLLVISQGIFLVISQGILEGIFEVRRMKVKAALRLHNHHLDLPKFFLCFSLAKLFLLVISQGILLVISQGTSDFFSFRCHPEHSHESASHPPTHPPTHTKTHAHSHEL